MSRIPVPLIVNWYASCVYSVNGFNLSTPSTPHRQKQQAFPDMSWLRPKEYNVFRHISSWKARQPSQNKSNMHHIKNRYIPLLKRILCLLPKPVTAFLNRQQATLPRHQKLLANGTTALDKVVAPSLQTPLSSSMTILGQWRWNTATMSLSHQPVEIHQSSQPQLFL